MKTFTYWEIRIPDGSKKGYCAPAEFRRPTKKEARELLGFLVKEIGVSDKAKVARVSK